MSIEFIRLFTLTILCLLGAQSRAQTLDPNYRELYTSDYFDAHLLSGTDAALIYQHLMALKPREKVLEHSIGWYELDVPKNFENYIQMSEIHKSYYVAATKRLVQQARSIDKNTAIVLVGGQLEPLYAYMAGAGVHVIPLHISRSMLSKRGSYERIKLYMEELIRHELNNVDHVLIVDTVASSKSLFKVVDLFVEVAASFKSKMQIYGFGILEPGSEVKSSDNPRISLSKSIRELPWKSVFLSPYRYVNVNGKYDSISKNGEPYSSSDDFSYKLIRDLERKPYEKLADDLMSDPERGEDLLALRKRLRFLLHVKKIYDAGHGKSLTCAQILSAI